MKKHKKQVGLLTGVLISNNIPFNTIAEASELIDEENLSLADKSGESIELEITNEIDNTSIESEIINEIDSDLTEVEVIIESSNNTEKLEINNKIQNESEVLETTTTASNKKLESKSSTVITIADEHLANAIREELELNEGDPITKGDLDTLYFLELYSLPITTLNGLEHATNLDSLHISDCNELTDISAINNHANLQTLQIIINDTTSINYSTLNNLPSLKRLTLNDENITNIDFIKNFTGLTQLDLYHTSITKIKALENLTDLVDLNISYTMCDSLDGIENLSKLEVLNCNSCNVSDLEPLKNLTSLEAIHFSNNNIVDISPLKNLTNLDSINLNNNNITDISALENLDKLNSIALGSNKITSVDALKNLSNIGHINLSSNQIADISPLNDNLVSNRSYYYNNQKISLNGSFINGKLTVANPLKTFNGDIITNITSNTVTVSIAGDNIVIENIPTGANSIVLDFNKGINAGDDLSGKITVTIPANTLPTINVSNKVILVGSDFDPLDGVTAEDNEDGVITNITVIEDTVKPNEPGEYSVTYEVSDNSGTKVQTTITVKVVNPPTITVPSDNLVIAIGENFDSSNGVTATDSDGKNITDRIDVIEDTVKLDTPGTYYVTYEVIDDYGFTSQKTITITVKNNPSIIVHGNTMIATGSKFDALDLVSATDSDGNNITGDIKVIKDDVDTSKPGSYEVVYEVTDKDGLKTEKTITVTVGNPPSIIAPENTIIATGSKFDALDLISATDSDGNDITGDIKVIKNDVDTSKPGSYEVVYEVTDKNGLKTEKTIAVTVSNPPSITVSDKTLTVGDKFNPLDSVTATDSEGNDLTNSIKVIKNDVNTDKAGTYTVVYEVIDKNGIKTEKSIEIIVKDKASSESNENNSEDKNNNSNSNTGGSSNSGNTNTESSTDKPQTGDVMSLHLTSALLSICGFASINRKKKEDEK